MNENITCPKCGHPNPINSTLCINCDESIRNYDYYKKDFKKYYELFSEKNLEILKEIPLTDCAYATILNSIVEIGEENLNITPETPSIPILMKITKPYARVQYDQENKHPDFLSYYSFNKIFINRNTPQQVMGGAIVHEFAHHLFNEIIKQSIMHLLNIEKNLYIESFAWYLTLQNEYLQIANEYVSHRVQEYFLPEQFNGYTSLITLLEEHSDLEETKIQTALNFGNTIVEDIIFIMEHYITKSNPFNPMTTQTPNIPFNVDLIDEQEKLNSIYTIIYKTFELFCKNKRDMLPILDDLANSYIYYNI
ncbi:hypothetical protein [Methanosphaera sp.]